MGTEIYIGDDRGVFGVLSNKYMVDIVINGVTYNSVEQYKVFKKAMLFGDYEIADKVMGIADINTIRYLGRCIRNYDEGLWYRERYGIVLEGVNEKFKQHGSLREMLIKTEGKKIIELSLLEYDWGIGTKIPSDIEGRTGKNLSGKILMEVRQNLCGGD